MGRSKLEFKQCPDCPAGVLLPRSAFRENTKEKNGKKYSMVVARCRKHEAQHNNEYQTTKVESGICRRCSLPLAEAKLFVQSIWRQRTRERNLKDTSTRSLSLSFWEESVWIVDCKHYLFLCMIFTTETQTVKILT